MTSGRSFGQRAGLTGTEGHILRRETLEAAYQLVKSNGGAPGIDDVSFEEIQEAPGGKEAFFDEIEEERGEKLMSPGYSFRVCGGDVRMEPSK